MANKSKGIRAERIEAKKHNGRKKAVVTLPDLVQNPASMAASFDVMCEAEIDYNDKMLAVKAHNFAEKGMTNDEIIAALGISPSTFYVKMREVPFFSYGIEKHRDACVYTAESSLYKLVTGYDYDEQIPLPSGKIVTVTRNMPPNIQAIKFFLTNRSKEWKNKVETALTLGDDVSEMRLAVEIKRRED